VILSDRSINEAIASGRLGIEPFDPKLVQPSSIDVRLDNKFLVFRNTKRAYIDVKQPADDLMELIEVGSDEPMFLHPHEFVLGSTIERVKMPDDLVGRLEGRSSLGRLGVVIHSSLPYDAPVLFRDQDGVLGWRPIGELVDQRLRGSVVGFDRDTFEVGFHEVTNWFRELPDKIYEVRLASGRRVHVTAGHNLLTVDSRGDLIKTPTRSLGPGSRVAIPKWIPDATDQIPEYRVLDLLSDDVQDRLLCFGPTVDAALRDHVRQLRRLLRDAGLSAPYYVRTRMLPLPILKQLSGAVPAFEVEDRFRHRGGGGSLPAVIRIDRELAWLLGLYVVEGQRRYVHVNIANTDQEILDRAQAALEALGLHVYRNRGGMTCCSVLLSAFFDGLGMGHGAASKKLPKGALGWPWQLLESLLEGLIGGDGSMRPDRQCLWTTSVDLVADTLLVAARLCMEAVTHVRPPRPRCLPSHVVSIASNRHKVLTSVPSPTAPLSDNRLGLSFTDTSRTALRNVERDPSRATVRIATLERLHGTYARPAPSVFSPIQKLTRLVSGDLLWDEVTEVIDTGRFETVYDLAVRAKNAHVENFLAGYGGIFVSNTAGFIDASFEGHVTLEISNLANLPIALYPGMRIGQISFSLMTTPADKPYGAARGSKYSGQQLPTASRLYLDFQP
jgi:deoxycytidine triphosphate deaminase